MRAELFHNVLNSIADAGRDILNRRTVAANQVTCEAEKTLSQLCRDLLSEKGEALGTALALEVIQRYQGLDQTGRLAFFLMLRDEFEPAQEKLEDAIYTYLNDPTRENRQALEQSVEAPRQALIRAMNMAPGGTSALLKMREDLQRFLKEDGSLKVVDKDFVHLFSSWFNRGFLRIQEISWETPATVLEKIIEYEAVHAIADWSDLRRRLASDRRCYGFFHPALPGEPLIFVEVALTNELSKAVQPLLDQNKIGQVTEADTAIFYSISNCQEGLKGISFGNFLIKQVVMELKQELPNIKTFSTLSPIPLFRKWLDTQFEDMLGKEDGNEVLARLLKEPAFANSYYDFKQRHIKEAQDLGPEDEKLLRTLCALYLKEVKRAQAPYDPVARFHLGNGARLERINWQGDISANGIKQSYGLMVNYLYDLNSIEQNHEAFVNNNEVIISDDVAQLLKAGK
ncbi:malonyl-CoA decarboxylase [Terasakiella pusilla]|uniref:malonyl-CoA decarboxylase n=1 Tax=Terasakiella pusilla TaxID=64973 RepID=UPI003AA87B95